MDRKVKVLLYGKFCGVLTQNEQGYLFEYEPGYRGRSLSLSMPVADGPFESKELHPFSSVLPPKDG